MRHDDLLERLTLRLAFSFALVVMASTLASVALPPPFVAQQQDRAVRAYCAEWRKTQGKQPLSADEMNKRVVTRLERRYPEVFPECRADHQGRCMSWINALVEGLRRYGQRSLNEVCSNLQGDGTPSDLRSSSSGPGRSRSGSRGRSLLTGHVQDCVGFTRLPVQRFYSFGCRENQQFDLAALGFDLDLLHHRQAAIRSGAYH
jgi:hypothetical protein